MQPQGRDAAARLSTFTAAAGQDPTEVGSGKIDWKRLLPAAHAAGVRDFFVEQEPPFGHSRLESVGIGFDHLPKLRA